MTELPVLPGQDRLLRLLTLTVVFTLLTIGWLSWTAFRSYHFVTKELPTLNRMEELRGQILVIYEAEIMSTLMSATTGDPQWEARHVRLESQMGQALEEVMRLAPLAAHSQAATQMDAANTGLLAMEHRAFELVRQGQQAEARQLLVSEEYEVQKKVYAGGIAELRTLLKQSFDTARAKRQVQALWSFVMTAISTPLLLLVWWFVLRAARQWQTVLVESNEKLKRQAAELEEFTHKLDEKVSERTKQLKESEIALLNMMEDAVHNREKVEQAYENLKREMAERKIAEEALRESEERYRKLVELSPDAICIRSQDKLVLANRAAVALFGAANANELQGRNFIDLVHPESRALIEERMRKLQETNETQPAVEEKLLRLNGTSFDAEVSKAPFMFHGKHSALVVIRDITEKKALNEKLLRNQRLESIGTLAGGIAHDLNNVLAPILMSIEILRLKYPETDAERILVTIETSAQRGADLVKQVLTFSRGLQGERTPVQLRHVIREMQSIIRQTFPKAITLRTEMPRDIWSVNGDVTQLHQVLMNLCVNARDAMPDGGTLGIKTEHLTLDEAFARMNPEARVGPYVVLTVTDTGTGMPPEIRERIFEPFFTTKEQGKGTGLGLATVLGIAKGHGGFVTVYSEVGRGTKFKVYLPAQPSAETQRADSERPPLPMGHGELILVADDEVAIQRIVQETLQMCGYTVVTVSNGAEAVAVCAQRAQELKLVITDMMMPIMDVPATVHALRVLAPNVKIIAASGLGSGVRETDPQKLGVDAFLRKPFTAETLLRTVGEVLGKG